jgi:transcriptional regulator with XRE-family HTH domain
MTKIRDLLASNIRKYRHARGWSQAKLAERVDTSAHYIGMLETRHKFPSPEMVEKLAAALDIDSTDLFRSDLDPDETIKSLQKAVLADMGDLVGNFVNAQVKAIDEGTEKTGEKK